MRPHCPCNGCNERTLTCHGFCSKYKEWKALLETEYEERKKENDRWGHPKRSRKHERIRLGIK